MDTLTWTQATAWRLRRQLLVDPAFDLSSAVQRLGGLHAQIMSCAELIAGVRTAALPADAVSTALWQERSLIKTWAMRGTLHLLLAAEMPAWVAALRRRQASLRQPPSWEKYHGISVADLHAVTDAVGELLDEAPRTREQLAAEVADRLRKPHLADVIGSGWGAVLKPAAQLGLLCFGPSDGRNVTFVSPQHWLAGRLAGGWTEPDQDAAMRAVVWRFLDSYGPATADDFARWWGYEARHGRRLFRDLADDLVAVDVEGMQAWLTPDGAEEAAKITTAADRPVVRLLPGFDPYVIAPISHRDRLIPDGCLSQVSRTAGWISPVLVDDGYVAGAWEHELTRELATVRIQPFAPVSAAMRQAAEADAARYEPLLGRPVTVTWS